MCEGWEGGWVASSCESRQDGGGSDSHAILVQFPKLLCAWTCLQASESPLSVFTAQ